MAGVLDGIRVLDLSRGIAGPMATMLLADHGADVVRIEPPGGDPFRSQLGYRAWNRGKRSAVLDLKAPEDLATFRKLAARADVLVELRRRAIPVEDFWTETPSLQDLLEDVLGLGGQS